MCGASWMRSACLSRLRSRGAVRVEFLQGQRAEGSALLVVFSLKFGRLVMKRSRVRAGEARLSSMLERLDLFARQHGVSRVDRRRAAGDARSWFDEALAKGLAPDDVEIGATSDGEGGLFVVVGDAASVAEACAARLQGGRAVLH